MAGAGCAGDFLAAAQVSQSTSNLPEICARVCPQERLCEGSCILGARGDPVAIGAVERFINDYAFAHGAVTATPAPPNGFRVAVVGSGPGGLACADELAQAGYAVTVFDALRIPGGLLVNGIPAFKLDKDIVARRVELLRARGVDFRLGVAIGRDFTLADLQRDFDAVFLGFGAQRPKPLDLPGAELAGVVPALPFLMAKNVRSPLSDAPDTDVRGKAVAVLGGGDTAMDCLRTALRSGAREAVCLYRRDLANMPGSRKEYANALEEGARFEFLCNPVAILADAAGGVRAVKCIRMELGPPEASGRRAPRAVLGSEFEVAAEVLIVAYGFDPTPLGGPDAASTPATDRWGSLVVDENQMTTVPVSSPAVIPCGGRASSCTPSATLVAPRRASTVTCRPAPPPRQAATVETNGSPAAAGSPHGGSDTPPSHAIHCPPVASPHVGRGPAATADPLRPLVVAGRRNRPARRRCVASLRRLRAALA